MALPSSFSNYQISPPRRSTAAKRLQEDESSRPQYLILGAFTSVPKIHFDKVQLGRSKVRTLIIRNPSSQDIWFRFLKLPSAAFEMSCETTNLINAEDQLAITFKWSPVEAGRCFEALTCQSDMSGVRLAVHLLGEAEPGQFKTKPLGLSGRSASFQRQRVEKPNEVFKSISASELHYSVAPNDGYLKHVEKRSVHLDEETASSTTSSPYRRETYLVTPLPFKSREFSTALSGIKFNLDDEQDDKENTLPQSLALYEPPTENTGFAHTEEAFGDEEDYDDSMIYSVPISESHTDYQCANFSPFVKNDACVDEESNGNGMSKAIQPTIDLVDELLNKAQSQLSKLLLSCDR